MLAIQPSSQPQQQQQQTLMSPTSSATLPKYSLVEPANHHTNPLVVYLSNSIKRDVGLLAAMGLIKEAGVRVINSYLPFATSTEGEESAIIRALSDSNCTLPLSSPQEDLHRQSSAFAQSAGNLPKAESEEPKRVIAQVKKLNRQRSETAPMRPAPLQQQPQQHKQQPANQQQQQQPVNLQFQRGPSSPRKERLHGHGGLSAKLGAFFNKLTLDSETSPRLKSSKGSTPTPIGSPRSPASPTHRHQQQQQQQHQHQEPFPKSPSIMSFQLSASPSAVDDDARRVHERSFSDAPKSPQLARISAAVETEPRTVHHRVTVSHCQAPPLGIGSRQHLARLEQESVRKPSQGSHLSTTASTTTAGYASTDSSHSESDSGASSHKPSSNRSSDRSSGASTLANRKRSFTHLGLSMESLSAEHAKSPLSAASSARSPQLRRTKPAANISSLQAKLVSPGAISEGMARLAAPTNSLGLVLQTSSAVLASKQKQKPMPLPAPIRTQRHHNSFSVVAKEPRSPTASSRVHNGLSSIVDSRNAMSPTAKSAAPGTLAFPPMPSEACQAAMLSGSTSSLQLSLAAEQAEQQRRAQPTPPHQITRALSDSTMDKTIAAMVVVATAAYDYTSSIKGDLEFKKGERIVIQSKINDDWWFGSILPEAGRGSTGRSGMFPRSHVAFI